MSQTAAGRRGATDWRPPDPPPIASFEQFADALPQIVWTSRPDGSDEWFNRGWYAFTGADLADTSNARVYVHPDDIASVVQHWERVQAMGIPFEREYRLRRHDGVYRRFLARVVPMRDAQTGALLRWVGSATDITERKEREEARDEERRRLVLALDAGQIGAWDLDLTTGVVLFSERAAAVLGLPPGETQINFAEWRQMVLPADRGRAAAAFEAAVRGRAAYELGYRIHRLSDGQERWVVSCGAFLRDEAGTAVRALGVIRDVTAEEQAEVRLRATAAEMTARNRDLAEKAAALSDIEERLRLATESAAIGIWDFYPITGDSVIDDRCKRMFGLPLDRPMTYADFLAGIYEEDRERVRLAVERAFDPAHEGEMFIVEYRAVRRDDGAVRWFRARGRALFRGGEGEGPRVAWRFIGTLIDVTERREGEQRRRFLEALTERIRPLLDPETVLWEAARSLGEFLGVSRCAYSEVDTSGRITTRRDYTDGIPSRLGTARLDDFGPRMVGELRAGRPVLSMDVRTDPRLSPEELARYRADELPAFLAVPLLKEGILVAVLAVHQKHPRAWTDAEVQLLGIVAERTWLAVENARLYRAAQREEERFRALVQASSQMVWSNDAEGRADDIPQWRAYTGQTAEEVRGYGWLEALHPDDRARAGAVWRRAFEARAVYECDYRLRGRDGAYRWFLSRAVPLLNEDGTLREYIGMSTNIDGERRAEEKQRRIAETLQRSMLITPPEGAFPHLDVKPHYEAAWDEAQVGGDFHDVYALAGGRVALVVGDVTGKGLEAASYTTEVKFALRAFLREDSDPASALSRLNRFLLEGQHFDRRAIGTFVCLSLAVVDPVGGEAVFAIAGCEPPLIVRAADRRIDTIRAGGLPLGTGFGVTSDGQRAYEREVVPLAPGDLLVMTTDGITEARPADQSASFFGIEGLVDAVLRATPEGNAAASLNAIAVAVLDAAKAFAGGRGLSDDVCLLLARPTAAPTNVTEDEPTWRS